MEIKENWQEEFFIDGWDKLQDDFPVNQRSHQEAEFIDRIAKPRGYNKVLDIPCGTGRLSIELAKIGYDITGIDFNPNAIKKAEARAKELNLSNTNWIVGDMRNIIYKEDFDLVTCMWGSIGYYSDEENFKFFKSCADALRDKGAFILDTYTLENIMRIYSSKDVIEAGDNYVFEEREFDFHTSRVNTKWTMFIDGKKLVRTGSIRIYTYKELTDMLNKAGFNNFLSFGGINDEKFTIDSRRLELIAIK